MRHRERGWEKIYKKYHRWDSAENEVIGKRDCYCFSTYLCSSIWQVYCCVEVGQEAGPAYAVKAINKQNLNNSLKIRRLEKECSCMSYLSHPNIVRFISFAFDIYCDGLVCVMRVLVYCYREASEAEQFLDLKVLSGQQSLKCSPFYDMTH